jgi:quercetin dioxygenase-like cupin family protein
VEIRRFGVGNRRPDGPPGTVGVRGQPIHADARGAVSELAFARNARVEPHSNPNTTWFIVIEGGGWVQVADERMRVAPGEAVCWPAGVVHSAWTELSEMRAFAVEFAGADDAALRGIFDGRALVLPSGLEGAGHGAPVMPGEGTLAGPLDRPLDAPPLHAIEGEPE